MSARHMSQRGVVSLGRFARARLVAAGFAVVVVPFLAACVGEKPNKDTGRIVEFEPEKPPPSGGDGSAGGSGTGGPASGGGGTGGPVSTGGGTGGPVSGGGGTGGPVSRGGGTGGPASGGGGTIDPVPGGGGTGATGASGKETSTISFETNPPGATVVLRSTAGETITQETPFTITVPRGNYTYEVNKAGFVKDKSAVPSVDLFAQRSGKVSLTLTPEGDRASLLATGNEAFAKGACAEATRLFDAIERPSSTDGAVGTEWAEARFKAGLCYNRLREYEKATGAFKTVLEVRPSQWGAKYELGITLCNATDYTGGRQTMRELGGPFLANVASDRKRAVGLLARYGAGYCDDQELSRKDQPERFASLRESAAANLEVFIMGASGLLEKAPPDLRPALKRALDDANERHKKLTGS